MAGVDLSSPVFLSIFFLISVSTVCTSPVLLKQFALAGGSARNIRHLPCVSRRTGETGICMFAFSCAKANGTHLGTCIDRFYFGSCCKIAAGQSDIDLALPVDSNQILEESTSTEVTHHISTFHSVDGIRSNYSTIFTQSTSPRTDPQKEDVLKPSKKPVNMKPINTSATKPTNVQQTFSTSYSEIPNPTTPSSYLSTFNSVEISTVKPFAVTTRKPVVAVSSTSAYSSHLGSVSISSTSSSSSTTTSSSISNSYSSPTSPKPYVPVGTLPGPSSQAESVSSFPSVSTFSVPLKPVFTVTRPSSTLSPLKPVSTIDRPGSTVKPGPFINRLSTTPAPSYPNINATVKPKPKPTNKPPSKPPTKPSGLKPTTRPPIKPNDQSVTTGKPHRPSQNPITKPSKPGPGYIQVPVTTLVPSAKPYQPTEPSVSNEILQPTTPSISSVYSAPMNISTNLISAATTIPPALVTWTTVDQVPVKPLPTNNTLTHHPQLQQPVKNNTTVTSTVVPPLSTEKWIEIPVSTHSETVQTETSDMFPTETPGIQSTWTATMSTLSETLLSTTSLLTTTFSTTKSPTTTPQTSVATKKPTSELTTKTPSTTPEDTTVTASLTTVSLNDSSTTQSSTSEVSTKPTADTTEQTTKTSFAENEVDTTYFNMTNFRDVCGRRIFPQSRIVGGEKATFGKWPWQISLRQWRTSTYLHKCGAALLNENWAITAAHCVENVPPSDLLLRLGEHDLSIEDEPYTYQERRVQIVASHPQFDPRTFEYDLALLRFYEPVTFQPNIIPICVPEDDSNFVGSTAFVTGWGRLYENGPLPSVLQEVSVPVINNTVCETMYRAAGYIEHIPEIFICAGWRKGGFDSCEGDSGGPMVIQRSDRRWLLAGVISWGIGCAEPNQPGVYTRISEFREWINQILQF